MITKKVSGVALRVTIILCAGCDLSGYYFEDDMAMIPAVSISNHSALGEGAGINLVSIGGMECFGLIGNNSLIKYSNDYEFGLEANTALIPSISILGIRPFAGIGYALYIRGGGTFGLAIRPNVGAVFSIGLKGVKQGVLARYIYSFDYTAGINNYEYEGTANTIHSLAVGWYF